MSVFIGLPVHAELATAAQDIPFHEVDAFIQAALRESTAFSYISRHMEKPRRSGACDVKSAYLFTHKIRSYKLMVFLTCKPL